MKIRKTFAAAVIAALLLNLFGTGVFAADETLSANVFMTVANGELLLAQEPVEVTDYNSDGKLTIDDAFYAAHEQYYEGGAEAGYGSEYGSYGLSLTKLWGVESGSGFGYYVNNASAYSLTDKVESGDYITAFVYTEAVMVTSNASSSIRTSQAGAEGRNEKFFGSTKICVPLCSCLPASSNN